MSHEHACPVCGRSFGSADALRSHRRSKRHFRSQRSEAPAWRRHAGKLAVVAGVVVLIGWLGLRDSGPRYPTTDSHWHADYAIEICGREVPPAPYSQGDVHTHGDGKIHVHPSTNASAGRDAHLGAFFRSIGGTIRDSVLDVAGEGTFRTGEDRCGDRPGRVAVYVDGERIADPDAYVPRDGEDVRIVFEPDT